jgi:hypothetical protein
MVWAQVFLGLITTVKASKATGKLDVLNPGFQARVHFFAQDGARRVGDVGFPAAELLEPAAGAGNAHGDSGFLPFS